MPKVEYTAGKKKGQTVEVSEEKKEELLDLGIAKEVREKEETENGVNAADFADTQSQYLTADKLSEGDLIEILAPGEVNDEWENERLEIPVEYEGEEYTLSLSKGNARNIIKGYGEDTGNWAGKKIRVVLIKEYPQLGTKGPILKPAEAVNRGSSETGKARA